MSTETSRPFGAARSVLHELLLESQALGFLGPGDVDDHAVHARRFLERIPAGARVLDLGSGGGLPGLVLADQGIGPLTLLDAQQKRTAFLNRAVDALGRRDVVVVCARAEEAGRDPELRGRFDAVVARSFGRPSVTAECAAPFLAPDGILLVSEPPSSSGDRWDREGLALLGLEQDGPVTGGLAVLRLRTPCPEAYPRRVGRPAKRPLF